MKSLLVSILLIAAAGCTSQKNLTELVKALSKDPATVRISYGPLIFERFVPTPTQPGGYVPGLVPLGGNLFLPFPPYPQTIPLTPNGVLTTNYLFWTPTNVVK